MPWGPWHDAAEPVRSKPPISRAEASSAAAFPAPLNVPGVPTSTPTWILQLQLSSTQLGSFPTWRLRHYKQWLVSKGILGPGHFGVTGRRVRVTWVLFILLRSLRWDTYPVASCLAAVQCCTESVGGFCAGGISQCLCLRDSGAALFLCKEHLNLPVRRVQVCGSSVTSCQLA